jgi:hypothetical protein
MTRPARSSLRRLPSHPDSERELVVWGSLGVETRELSDESVRRSVDRYLRISPPWLLAHTESGSFFFPCETFERQTMVADHLETQGGNKHFKKLVVRTTIKRS